MTMINTHTIDLDRSELVLDPLTDGELFAERPPIVIDNNTGPMVVVSTDRLIALEMMVFASLEPGADVVQLDAPIDLIDHLASQEMAPSLVLAAAPLVEATERLLDQLGYCDVAVLAI